MNLFPCLIDIHRRKGVVCTRRHGDAVFAIIINHDGCDARGSLGIGNDKPGVDTLLLESLNRLLPEDIISNLGNENDVTTELGSRNGLVGTLSPGAGRCAVLMTMSVFELPTTTILDITSP